MKNIENTTLVAVYGSLRKGLGNHRLLSRAIARDGAEFVNMESVNIPYRMVSLGGFPGLIPAENSDVIIETYRVDDQALERLDGLEGYRGEGEDNFYDRDTVETSNGNAFIYTLTDKHADNKTVESGDWYLYRKGIKSSEHDLIVKTEMT